MDDDLEDWDGIAVDTGEYTFPASLLPKAERAIEKANRRLTRAGGAGAFTYTCREHIKTEAVTRGGSRRTEHTAVVTLTLNHPVIAVGNWEFVATLVHEDGGAVITRTAPGRSLGDTTRFATRICDHCHTSRLRRDTYVLRDRDTGVTKQIGSSCLVAFLGIRPAGLWSLQWELPDIDDEQDTNDLAGYRSGAGGGRRDLRVPVREVVATALAVSDHGKNFVSRAAADEVAPSTADRVGQVIFGTGGDRKTELWREQMRREAAAITAERDEIGAVLETGRNLAGDSDYACNIRTVVDLEWADHRNIGLIASLVKVHYGELSRRVTTPWAAGFLGETKTRLLEVPARITTLRVLPGHYGPRTLVILQTEDGHAIKWIATGAKPDLEQGMTCAVQATIKAQAAYRGIDQTVITRAKITITSAEHAQTAPRSP